MLVTIDGKLTLDASSIEVVVDQSGARGKLILEESNYGIVMIAPLVHPQRSVCLLDMFYASITHIMETDPLEVDDPPFQIVIDSPAQYDDPVGRVRFFPERTIVDFESGVHRFEAKTGDDLGRLAVDSFFAYPLEEENDGPG